MIKIGNIKIGGNNPVTVIAGPCVVENREMIFYTADKIKRICDELKMPLVFKSSYKKANRTSLNSFTGYNINEGLSLLKEVKNKLNIPILTDIHETSDAYFTAQVADIIQIPAFLSRQTDLLLAAGETGKIINIKKGQFLAPENMKQAAEKVQSTGNTKILLTERGASFGYKDLIVDFRSFAIMQELGYPIIYDVTHSLQKPSSGNTTGGTPEYILMMAKASIATGKVKGLFIETHHNPEIALSDAATMLPLEDLEKLLEECLKIVNR